MGPEWGFSCNIKDHCIELFWFLAWNYSSIKNLNWHKWFFGRNTLYWSFWTKGLPKWAHPKWGFLGEVKSQCKDLFWFFAWSYSSIKTLHWCRWLFFCMGEGNNLVLVQNIPKIRFSRYYVKSVHGTFLIFCMALQQHGFTTSHCIEFLLFFCMMTQQHKFWKLGKVYFDKVVVSGFLEQNVQKWAQN